MGHRQCERLGRPRSVGIGEIICPGPNSVEEFSITDQLAGAVMLGGGFDVDRNVLRIGIELGTGPSVGPNNVMAS